MPDETSSEPLGQFSVLSEPLPLPQEREASEQRLSLILDNVQDIVFLLEVGPEETYRFLFVNPPFLTATGLRAEQIIGRRIQEVIPAPAHPLVLGKYAEAILERRPVEWQETSVYPSGERTGEARVVPLFDDQGYCKNLLGTVHDITALRQAQERSEQIFSLSAALGEAITTMQVAEVIIQAALPIFQAGMGLVALLSEDGRQFHCERIVGVPPAEADLWRSFPADARLPLADAVRERRLVVLSSDEAHDAAYPEMAGVRPVAGDGALVAVPLLIGERCIGGIGLICPPERCRDEEQKTFLWTLASQCALALERARLYDAERRAREEALAEVAERRRTEAARREIAEREHRIAEQLQAALQPPTPDSVPGLQLAAYYRAALEDQGVGGDFSDVFSDDKNVTHLVVGDLSGKGLAAASQVAMVRHMLRFALYNGRTLAGPITSLNATLADNDLLDGFTTLFVGRYDAQAKQLTYVNCGQDAGLILRADSGEIEPLPPTGPVLGAITGASYTEEAVTLNDGDVLALYTDGLTEAGPTRTALLTGDGVAELLRRQSERGSAGAIVNGLLAGVDAYAGQGVRDDQCLLVGVVRASP